MRDIFCRIVKKEIPAHVVYETEGTLAFLDITPSAPGHVLVIPKKHGDNISEFSEEELGKIMESVKVVAGKIEKVFNPDSITIGINHKEKKGVSHLHVHLIPRWDNDQGRALQGVVNNPPKEKLDIIAEKIRNA